MKKMLFFLAALGVIPCLLLSGCSGAPAETTTTSTTTGSTSSTSGSGSHMSVATTTSTATATASMTNTTGSRSSTSVMTTASTSTTPVETTTTVQQDIPVPQDALSVLVIGDSNTEIGFITNALQYLINEDYQPDEYGYYPFTDGFRANTGAVRIKLSTGWNRKDMTEVAGNTDWSGSGLASATSTPGQTAQVTFIGTQIKLFYATQAGGGSMVCTVDGKQETTINTDGTPETKVEIFSGLDPAATHTLEIRVVDGPVILCGVDVTEKTGRGAVHNWGNGGATTTHFAMIDQSVFKTGVALLEPDVVVVLLGTNDAVSAKDFAGNQTAILNAVKEAAPAAKRLLVSTFDTGYHPIQMERYLAQSYPTAAKNTGSFYWNMHEWFGPYDESRMLDMGHCDQTGGAQIAAELYEQIKQVLNQ